VIKAIMVCPKCGEKQEEELPFPMYPRFCLRGCTFVYLHGFKVDGKEFVVNPDEAREILKNKGYEWYDTTV